MNRVFQKCRRAAAPRFRKVVANTQLTKNRSALSRAIFGTKNRVLPFAPKFRGPVVTIPLSSVVSTSGQAGLERASANFKLADGQPVYVMPYGKVLGELLKKDFVGSSNVFLIDAPTIDAAVLGTMRVFSADQPVTLNMPNPPTGNYWLAVFLGISGSNAPNWLVDSVTIQGSRIRFSYHWQGATTKDQHHYYYWIPLGSLKSGTFKLELYATNLSEVTLMRRVEVKAPGQR